MDFLFPVSSDDKIISPLCILSFKISSLNSHLPSQNEEKNSTFPCKAVKLKVIKEFLFKLKSKILYLVT